MSLSSKNKDVSIQEEKKKGRKTKREIKWHIINNMSEVDRPSSKADNYIDRKIEKPRFQTRWEAILFTHEFDLYRLRSKNHCHYPGTITSKIEYGFSDKKRKEERVAI